jgi:hypothetical protein
MLDYNSSRQTLRVYTSTQTWGKFNDATYCEVDAWPATEMASCMRSEYLVRRVTTPQQSTNACRMTHYTKRSIERSRDYVQQFCCVRAVNIIIKAYTGDTRVSIITPDWFKTAQQGGVYFTVQATNLRVSNDHISGCPSKMRVSVVILSFSRQISVLSEQRSRGTLQRCRHG